MNTIKGLVESFKQNISGSFLPIIGVALPVVLLATGAALETSNISRIKTHMQASMDSALVAVSLKAKQLDPSLTKSQRERLLNTEFKNYYSANFSEIMFSDESYTLQDQDFSLDYDDDENTAKATVNYLYKTVMMSAFGRDNYLLASKGSSLLAGTAENYVIDIVMCIDATGSMQRTLDAVKIQAKTFSTELRKELGVAETSESLKIRVKPIFYRDWNDEYYYQRYKAGYYSWQTRGFRLFGNLYEGGFIEHEGFLDLDPNVSTGLSRVQQSNKLASFIGSERAAGGFDWPEGAGACLNEGIRSEWFDNQSDEAREYFGVEESETISDADSGSDSTEAVKITTIPVIVFWTDAPISSLGSSKRWLSPTTPTSYSKFRQLWNDKSVIDQNYKLLIHFGPGSGRGWNNIRLWDRYAYGGSLYSGNSQGVKRIADEIKKAVPELLRLAS